MTTYPPWLGYWPASLGLFAFVWQELVNESSTFLGSVRLWLALYVGAMLVGSALFGDTWFKRADPFEVYSTLIGRLCPIGRRGDGRLVLRSPLANLDGVEVAPGLVAVMAVLLGSTAFDSYKDKISWVDFVGRQSLPPEVVNTLGLLGFCLAVAITFSAGGDGHRRVQRHPADGPARAARAQPGADRRGLHDRALLFFCFMSTTIY